MKNKHNKASSSQKGTKVRFEDEDGGDMDVDMQITPAYMNSYFRIFCDKKGAAKEEALLFIVEALTKKPAGFYKFLEKNFLMLLSCCLNVIKEGSAVEVPPASSVIGLLAMIIDSQDRTREVYEDSIPVFSQALKSKSKTWNVVDSLAIMTFFAAENSHETEEVMKMIWNLIDPEPKSSMFPTRHPPSVLAAAISAWSFLLSSIDGWRLNCKYWQGVISCLSSLLCPSDEAVAIAASEALELVFGFDCLEKFSTEANSLDMQEIKGKTDKHLGGKTKKENIDVFIGNQKITLSTWSQMLQLNFIERFLGEEGLAKHMMENENLQRVFDFTPQRRNRSAENLYSPEREEVTVSVFLPELPTPDDDPLSLYVSNADKQRAKRMSKTPSSVLSKGRTQLRNKQRALSKESNLFAVTDQNQEPCC